MLERLLLALDRHPRFCQAVLALLLLVAVIQLPKLKIDDSPERWLPANTREAWRALDDHFSFGDSVAIGVEFRRPLRDADIVPLRKLRQELAAIEGMRHAYDSSLIAEDIEGVSLTELLDPANRERFKLYEGAMWGKEQNGHGGRTLLVVGELVYPKDRKELDRLRRNVVQQLSRIINQAKSLPEFEGVRFHTAGSILLMDELERLASRAVVFLPLSILIGLVSLVLGFRSIPSLFLAVGGGGAAMLIVLGFTAWNGHGLGALTMSTPTLISIIAIATTVHFASDAADHGDSSRTRGERDRMIRWVGLPCFGAAFAAAIGFLMLAFNQLGPVRTLGLELFVGSLLAFFCVLIFSQIMPIRRAYSGRILMPERFGRWSDFLARHSTSVTATTLLVMGLFIFFAWPRSPESRLGLKVDADPFSSFFRPDNPLVQAKNHLSEQQFGLYQLEVILVPQSPSSAANTQRDAVDPAREKAVQAYSDQLAARKDLGVLSVVSTAAFRERQRQFQEELSKRQREDGLLATAYNWAFKLPKVYEHLKNFNETFENWNRDKLNQGAIRLTFLAHDRVPDGFKQLMDLAEVTKPAGFDCYFAGTVASVVQLAEGMVYGMWLGLASAALVMMGVCVFLFRSIRLTAIAFLPNMFPIVIVYGFMALVGIPITSGSSMVATVALGIALNDTIHFMLHYRKLRYDEGYSLDVTLHETFEHIGRPIILTSVVFTAGFTIFLLSDFLPLFQFGLLATIAMVAALVGDILLLPSLLRTFDRRGPK